MSLWGLEPSKVSSSLAFALPFLLSQRLSSSVIKLMASAKFGASSLSKDISPGWFGSMSSRILGLKVKDGTMGRRGHVGI